MADNDSMEEPSTPSEASTPMERDTVDAMDTENLPPPRLMITKMVRTNINMLQEHAFEFTCILSPFTPLHSLSFTHSLTLYYSSNSKTLKVTPESKKSVPFTSVFPP
jgi:hypothetical protein